MREERSATKSPLGDDEARKLVDGARRVIIAKGRGRRDLSAAETDLAALKGPTGRYRAPMVLVGDTLVVGFAPEALAEL